MTANEQAEYARITKQAWIIYYVAALVLACVLVFFVARDVEEQFFYGMMTIAGSYVLRPSDKYMSKLILKFTGKEKPADPE